MKSYTLWLVLAVIITSTSAANSSNNHSPLTESLEQKVQNLQADLETKGYEVVRGAWNLFTIEDFQFAIAAVGNCFGNNPAAPYIIPSVPLWPDEFVDQHLKDLIGPTASAFSRTVDHTDKLYAHYFAHDCATPAKVAQPNSIPACRRASAIRPDCRKSSWRGGDQSQSEGGTNLPIAEY